jgi:hypothetical protein
MSTQERTQLLTTIAQLFDRYPHWRLGQLIANVAGWADQDVWDVDDQQLLAAAQLHLAQLAPQVPAISARHAASCSSRSAPPAA